jgi:hypothetical protein
VRGTGRAAAGDQRHVRAVGCGDANENRGQVGLF